MRDEGSVGLAGSLREACGNTTRDSGAALLRQVDGAAPQRGHQLGAQTITASVPAIAA